MSLGATALAAPSHYISVGAARTKKSVIAFPEIRRKKTNDRPIAEKLETLITNDLLFMDLFRFLPKAAYVEDAGASGLELGQFKMSDWSGIGAEYLIKSNLESQSGNTLILHLYLYEVSGAKQIYAKRYTAASNQLKGLAHTAAGDIVQALTGLPSIFMTKIAMTCDRTGKKEIYVMDFDGGDPKQVTHHRSLAFAPAWSPDSTRLAYSVYSQHQDNIKNIDLHEFDFTHNTRRTLSQRKGINSGATYSPTEEKLALTLSFGANPSLYILDLKNLTRIHRVTQSLGFDVDPSWSPDGKQLAFVSSRSGMPMIFIANADGSQIQRLTYAGRYNATPSWSPQNNKIAFAGWTEQGFDIFTMNTDGTHITRLTQDAGNNEDPFFSPDGNFIVFSSNRTGQKNIYLMNVEGGSIRRLTNDLLGNCVSPKWSNPPIPVRSETQK